MKIGWLVWEYEDDEHPILLPDGHDKLSWCARKVRIVYAEVADD
jgi:hypothetical protein